MVLYKKSNTYHTIANLLDTLAIKFTPFYLKNSINRHPNSQSLACLSDILDDYQIENKAIKIEAKNLQHFPVPFIACTYSKNGNTDFLLITQIKKDNVIIKNSNSATKIINANSFILTWTGVVLYAEKNVNSSEPNFNNNKKIETLNILKLGVCSVVIVLGLSIYKVKFPHISLPYQLLTLTKLVGTFVSIILLSYLFNSSNSFITRVCQIGKKKNCNSILNSKASKILGVISWSEVGFSYFSGSICLLFFFPQALNILFVLAFLAFSYIFYSIYYQWKVAKEWCVLCLLIQTIFFIEFVIAAFYINVKLIELSFLTNIIYFIIFSLPTIAYIISKPFIISYIEQKKTQKELSFFKSNLVLFNEIINSYTSIYIPQQLKIIEFGNENSNFEITFISNPFCKQCSIIHEQLEKLFFKFGNKIKLQIIFGVPINKGEQQYEIAKQMISIYNTFTKEDAFISFSKWYKIENKNWDAWNKYFKITLKGNEDIFLEEHFSWCLKNKITATPKIFVNNRELPDYYTINDLKYFIPA